VPGSEEWAEGSLANLEAISWELITQFGQVGDLRRAAGSVPKPQRRAYLTAAFALETAQKAFHPFIDALVDEGGQAKVIRQVADGCLDAFRNTQNGSWLGLAMRLAETSIDLVMNPPSASARSLKDMSEALAYAGVDSLWCVAVFATESPAERLEYLDKIAQSRLTVKHVKGML